MPAKKTAAVHRAKTRAMAKTPMPAPTKVNPQRDASAALTAVLDKRGITDTTTRTIAYEALASRIRTGVLGEYQPQREAQICVEVALMHCAVKSKR